MWTGITSGETKIVYCKDSERQANHETVQLIFWGIRSEREEHVISEGEILYEFQSGGE